MSVRAHLLIFFLQGRGLSIVTIGERHLVSKIEVLIYEGLVFMLHVAYCLVMFEAMSEKSSVLLSNSSST